MGSDIVIHLSTICPTQTDDPPAIQTIDKSHKKEPVPYWSKSNKSDLCIIHTIINPDKSHIPIELSGRSQGDSMLAEVGRVLPWVEIDAHTLM